MSPIFKPKNETVEMTFKWYKWMLVQVLDSMILTKLCIPKNNMNQYDVKFRLGILNRCRRKTDWVYMKEKYVLHELRRLESYRNIGDSWILFKKK